MDEALEHLDDLEVLEAEPAPQPSLASTSGSTQMWGLSPAKNLTHFMLDNDDAEKRNSEQRNLNFLLVGEPDVRHSLKTLASNWTDLQDNKVQFHFYVVESFMDLYARQMVLWTLAFEPLEHKGLREKTDQFMAIFGNLLFRPPTKKYLLSSLEKLIKFVTGDPEMKAEFPMFDLTYLKLREKDQIVDILKFWQKNSDATGFDVAKCWDVRLRKHLGERYDSRLGVFDWDYNMNLLERGTNTGIISLDEYKIWRNTGIAFSDFEGDYSLPNLTLTAGATRPCHNYWGDIQTGPFIAHGIECDDGEFFVKTNDKYKKKSSDVTKHNLESIFATISSKTKQKRLESLKDASANGKPKFTVHFLTMGGLLRMAQAQNARFKNHFHLIYLANPMGPTMQTCNLPHVMRPGSVIIAEDASFLLEFQGQMQMIFDIKIAKIAQHVGLQLVSGEGAENDAGDAGDRLKDIKYFKLFKKQHHIENPDAAAAPASVETEDKDKAQGLEPKPEN